jgi:hypothetical protein
LKKEWAMTLEQQLEKLAELGLPLSRGITVDDLLYSYSREDYEREPFEVLLSILGDEVWHEPWGRTICDSVWTLDTECIHGTGDYVRLVKRLCLLTSNLNYLENICDNVDTATGEAWLSYTVKGQERTWTPYLRDDWVDTSVLLYVMQDLMRDGKRIFAIFSGQAIKLFYLEPYQAVELRELTNLDLKDVSNVLL